MITKIKRLFLQYKEAILYLFFGGCTTVVNIAAFYLCDRVALPTALSTAIAWFLAVLFAYLTNRRWVFRSKAVTPAAILKEAGQFFFFRVVTGAFDVVFMVVTVDYLHANSLLMKIADNVVVVVLNYLFSKLLIFKKK